MALFLYFLISVKFSPFRWSIFLICCIMAFFSKWCGSSQSFTFSLATLMESFLFKASSMSMLSLSAFLFFIYYSLCLCFSQLLSWVFFRIGSMTTERLTTSLLYMSCLKYQIKLLSNQLQALSLRPHQEIHPVFTFIEGEVSELQLELSYMQTQERGSKCCQYVKQTSLITLVLLFLVTFYSVDESVLTIGSLSSNITDLNNKSLPTTSCDSICTSPFLQPFSDLQCCQDSTILSTCKSKQQCSLETLNKYQNELNNEYLYLFMEIGIEIVIIFIIAVYCIKQRMQKNNRQRQDQSRRNIQDNNHAAIFNVVGSLRIRREYQPPSLQSSFLNGDENNCAICLQSLLQAKAIKLKCHHMFHSSCIKEWMDTRDTCPICRTRN